MKKKNSKKYYVMFGFEEADPTNTVYLKIDENEKNGSLGVYRIVNSASEATIFPAKNYKRKNGFGTPEQWADFFAEEAELQDWNFHPVPYKNI